MSHTPTWIRNINKLIYVLIFYLSGRTKLLVQPLERRVSHCVGHGQGKVDEVFSLFPNLRLALWEKKKPEKKNFHNYKIINFLVQKITKLLTMVGWVGLGQRERGRRNRQRQRKKSKISERKYKIGVIITLLNSLSTFSDGFWFSDQHQTVANNICSHSIPQNPSVNFVPLSLSLSLFSSLYWIEVEF